MLDKGFLLGRSGASYPIIDRWGTVRCEADKGAIPVLYRGVGERIVSVEDVPAN